MLRRGHRFILEPDLYPKHAELELRLERDKRWKRVGEPDPEPDLEPQELDSDGGEGLLPHQIAVVERLRRARTQTTSETPSLLGEPS